MELFGAPLIVVLGAFALGLIGGTFLARIDIGRGKK